MKQNWIRLKLISKDKMDVSGLESIHANYIFGMTTATALSIIVLGYIIFILLSPEHIGDQYEMIYSTLTNDTSVINDHVAMKKTNIMGSNYEFFYNISSYFYFFSSVSPGFIQ